MQAAVDAITPERTQIDETVWVTCASNQRKGDTSSWRAHMNHRNVVIIGGGPAGRVIVHALHSVDPSLSAVLIKDEAVNVNRCAVPYGIPDEKPLGKYLIPNELVTDFGAELVIDRVSRVDSHDSSVALAGGGTLTYDHLVLATGSNPIIPPIPGIQAKNITPVRSRDDLQRLRELATEHRRAVIVGGGYIGVEIAVVLRRLGLDVAIVEMLPHLVQMATEDEFIGVVEDDLAAHGVDLLTTAKVVEFQTEDHVCTGVRLEDGRTIETDFVVLAIGVTPNIELAAAAGIETSRFGIVTDGHLRTSVANIYASGDCAEKRSFVTRRPTRGEFGTNAVFMSKVVAANILGRDVTFPGVINASATTTFNYSLGSAGLTRRAAEAEGIPHIVGTSEVLDRYPMMDHAAPIRTKLIFEEVSGRLLGGSVLRHGHATASNVDFLSFAIQMRATLDDVLHLQYATHPELAAKPSDNMYVFAALDAQVRRSPMPVT